MNTMNTKNQIRITRRDCATFRKLWHKQGKRAFTRAMELADNVNRTRHGWETNIPTNRVIMALLEYKTVVNAIEEVKP